VWLAGRIVCISRACPASKFLRERVSKALNRPGHGTSFGKASRFPKGTFKVRTSKGIFSQFLVFRARRAPKVAFYPERKAILLRVSERPTPESLSFRPRAKRRGGILVSPAALPLSPKRFSRCGNHLEILWEAMIDGIHTAPYACKVSRTVGFA
jgi:hypothetical protein